MAHIFCLISLMYSQQFKESLPLIQIIEIIEPASRDKTYILFFCSIHCIKYIPFSLHSFFNTFFFIVFVCSVPFSFFKVNCFAPWKVYPYLAVSIYNRASLHRQLPILSINCYYQSKLSLTVSCNFFCELRYQSGSIRRSERRKILLLV